LRHKIRTSSLKSTPNNNESSPVDLEAAYKERERLLQTLAMVRNKKKRLAKETSRLFAKVKSLDSILVRYHSEPEYLKRDE